MVFNKSKCFLFIYFVTCLTSSPLLAEVNLNIEPKTETNALILNAQKINRNLIEPIDADNSLVLDLERVVDITTSQNLDISIAGSRLKQSKGAFISSFADLMPSLRASSSVERFEGGEVFFGATPIDLDRTTYRFGLFGDYSFQTGGKYFFQVASAKNRLNQAKEFRNRSFQMALRDAVISYFTWLNDIARNDVSEQSLNEAETQLALSESRLRNGFATQLEFMQNSTLKSESENLVLETKNRELISSVNLAAVLNVPINVELTTKQELLEPKDFITEDLSLEETIKIAAANRPDLKELNYAIKEAKSNFAIAIADFFPTVSASGYLRGIGPKTNDLDSSQQGLISVDVDVLRNLGVGKIGNLKTRKAAITEAKLLKQKQLVDATKEIARSYYNAKLFHDKLRVAADKLKSTSEAYRIALARLKSSVGINLEVVQALTKYTEARLEYLTAAANYNSSQIGLMYEMGQLTPEKILVVSDF